MTANTSEQTSLDLLISLKSQYEYALNEANSKSGYLREQLAHVNALLLNQLLPKHLSNPLSPQVGSTAPVLAFSPSMEAVGDQSSSTPSLPVTEPVPETASKTVPGAKPRAQKRGSAQGAPKVEKAPSKRNSLPLLPAYQGLLKLDAIAKVLEAQRNQEVTIDSVVQTLYGNLSAADHKAERLRMKTALFQGVKKGLWQKSDTPSSYFVGSLKGQGRKAAKAVAAPAAAPVPKSAAKSVAKPKPAKATSPRSAKDAKAPTAAKAPAATKAPGSKRNSLPFLPEFVGMKKLDAIGLVLQRNQGEVLHHDTIIQTLYGDLSLADLKDERVRIKTALLKGVKDGLWEKASVPSSYFLASGTAGAKSKSGIKTVKPRSSAKARSVKK